MGAIVYATLLAALAGAAIPLGAWLARFDRILPGPLRNEANHWIMAFGAGALLSAVALVLIPEGIDRVPGLLALLPLLAGAIVALVSDIAMAHRGGSKAQFMAMLMDFIPEAIAMGAILTADPGLAVLLAILIGAQNLPEGFNADRELAASSKTPRSKRLLLFLALVPAGPLAAVLGITMFSGWPELLGVLMLFSAGGILYLMFQDIAPKCQWNDIGPRPWGQLWVSHSGWADIS